MLESKCSQFEHLLSDLVVCPSLSVLCWSLCCCYITQDFMQLLFSASAFIAHSICTLRALLSLTGASWECSSSGVSLTGLGHVCHPSSRVSIVCSYIVILFDCLFISDSFFSNDFSRLVAEEYLHYFSLTEMTLDQALRSAH